MIEKLKAATEKIAPSLDELSLYLYQNPELGNEEHKAAEAHVKLLRDNGFDVEFPFCEVPTGYKATFKAEKKGKTVGFMAEYDALPGVGHGCGHNLLGATSLGAAIALSTVLEEIGGTIEVYGTPAEETCGAKVTYSKAGEFDHLDFALIAHPASEYRKSKSSLALMPIEFEFFGKSAHAASEPWEGVNALDAALVSMNAINALREHVHPTSRIHGVIIKGGEAANVVPEYAKVQYYVRSTTTSYNNQLVERVKNCARAGALATGCELKCNKYELEYDNLVTNEVLMDTFANALEEVAGIQMQEASPNMGSLDMGQVSHHAPAIHAYFGITGGEQVPGHTKEFAQCTLTQEAKKHMRITITTLALCAQKIMSNEDVYQRIRKEFEQASF